MIVPTTAITTGRADPLQCCSQENTVQSNDWCMLCRKCYQVHAAKNPHLIASFKEITTLSMLDLNPIPQSSELGQKWPSEVSGANPFLPCTGFHSLWFMEVRHIVKHIIWNCWKEKLRKTTVCWSQQRYKKALTEWSFFLYKWCLVWSWSLEGQKSVNKVFFWNEDEGNTF